MAEAGAQRRRRPSMDSDISEIVPGLYLGGLSSLQYLEAMGITHVLSVLNYPVRKDLSAYATLQLPLQDSEGVNMLQFLPAAIKFLDGALLPPPGPGALAPAAAAAGAEARSTDSAEAAAAASGVTEASAGGSGTSAGGSVGVSSRVLVHCQAGVSRSASVVVAWLMRSRRLSVDEALALVRAQRPAIDPNEGFRSQLQLFNDMRCSLDPAHPVYRMWCLEELSSRYEDEGWVDPDSFAVLPEGQAGMAAALAAQQTLYRCRKCRTLLATSAQVVPVEAAMGHRTFRDFYRRRREPAPSGAAPGAPESCLFVEPIKWMAATVTGTVAGKLHCPKCEARLGSFNWSGISNPSAAWVTPAFQLHHSKIDTVSPQPAEALANVRRPLVGAAAGRATAATQGATSSSGAGAAAAPPSLPASLPAAVRRLGLGSAGAGAAEEGGEEQLPEPSLDGPGDERGPEPDLDQQPPGAAAGSGFAYEAPLAEDGGSGRAAAAEALVPAGSAWFTHLILDCDGVMVDSEAASCEALRRAILQVTGFDIPHDFPQDYVEVFGMDVRSCVAHYREKFGREDWEEAATLAPRVQVAKEGHYTALTEGGIRAFDGAERLIRKALAAGMQVGVASSGAPEKIARNLHSSGLAPLLPPHAIVSASHVAAGKPAPDVYLAAMRATGCTDPWRALVVEDAVNGLKAARAAGAFAIGITNQLPGSLLAPWADLVVAHLDEVEPASLVPPPRPPRGAASA